MIQEAQNTRARHSRLLVGGGLIVVAAAWLWAWLAPVGAAERRAFSGPVQSVSDIPPDIQEVLQQAPAPTHSEPTPWGLFVINPVINGNGILNPQESPIPSFSGPDVEHYEAAGPATLAELRKNGFVVPDVSVPELVPAAGFAFKEGGQYWTKVIFGVGDVGLDTRTAIIDTYTPQEPVVFDEFPDNAIRDFAADYAINGYPTLSVVPDNGTSDPRGERVVAWSQDGAVYVVRTTGPFTDGEVFAIARNISTAMQKS